MGANNVIDELEAYDVIHSNAHDEAGPWLVSCFRINSAVETYCINFSIEQYFQRSADPR